MIRPKGINLMIKALKVCWRGSWRSPSLISLLRISSSSGWLKSYELLILARLQLTIWSAFETIIQNPSRRDGLRARTVPMDNAILIATRNADLCYHYSNFYHIYSNTFFGRKKILQSCFHKRTKIEKKIFSIALLIPR